MSSNERTSLAFPEFNRQPIRLSSFPKGLKSQTRAAMTKPEQNKYNESSISQAKRMRPYLPITRTIFDFPPRLVNPRRNCWGDEGSLQSSDLPTTWRVYSEAKCKVENKKISRIFSNSLLFYHFSLFSDGTMSFLNCWFITPWRHSYFVNFLSFKLYPLLSTILRSWYSTRHFTRKLTWFI